MVPLSGTIKQCRPQFNVRVVKFHYPKDARLCVCGTLQQYLDSTQELRQGMGQESYSLFLSFIKLHKPVTSDTVVRGLRKILDLLGVDTTIPI